MKPTVLPLLRRPGDGETITDRAERTVRLLLAHDLLDVTWTRYEPGERGPDPHVHREHVDSFYVLEGELVFGVGSRLDKVRAPAGTFVSVPQNVVHTFANKSGGVGSTEPPRSGGAGFAGAGAGTGGVGSTEPPRSGGAGFAGAGAGSGRALFLNFHSPSGGFADHLRGRSDGFDSFDPPDDGGRPATDVIVSLPGEGERFVRKHLVNMIKSELPEISTFHLVVDPAWEGIDTHEHADHVDTFFVLEGETGLASGDGVLRAGAGSFWASSPGVRHGVRNDPGQRIVLLNVHAPDAGFAESIRRR